MSAARNGRRGASSSIARMRRKIRASRGTVAAAQLFRSSADLAMSGEVSTDRGALVFDTDFVSGRREIRVLLADDHAVLRAGLRALLEKEPHLVVVGEAASGAQAVALAKTTRPHVVLMDLAMPGKGGIEATRRIVALGIGAKVLVLTALPQELQLCEALEAGASGFMGKIAPVEELTRAVRAVADDRLFLDEDAARLIVLQRYRKAGQVDDEMVTAGRVRTREREGLAPPARSGE